MAWLIHELMHVAQAEIVGSVYIIEAVWAQFTGGYRYSAADLTKKHFSEFNREQQGDIVRDYYWALYGLRPASLPQPIPITSYANVIQELRAGKI